MTRIGSLLFFFIVTLGPLFARAVPLVSVQSSIDNDRLGVGQPFTFTVVVVTSENPQVDDPRPPDLQGFELMTMRESNAVSQKMIQTPQGMDYETQRRREFHYSLRALKPGRLSIGAFEVVVDGKAYHTQPQILEIANEPQEPKRPQRGGRGGGSNGLPPGWGSMPGLDEIDRAEEELFNQLLQQRRQMMQPPSGPSYPRGEPQFRTLPQNPNEAFFVQVEVDKTEVYEGEQVTASWFIYTRGQMETLDRVKFPDLRGFWKEIIEEVPTIQFTEEIVNGVPYRKALLASHALFPIKAGTATIDEYKIKSKVRTPSQLFGFGEAREYVKSSQRVSIKVKPLPTEGRPSNFSGAVGDFEIRASTDNPQVPANQPFSLKVRFEGMGNAKLIELPAIQWPEGLEVYDTKSDSKFFKNGRSYKQFEVLVIPRKEGPLEIPAIGVSIFDPRASKYVTKTTDPVHLQVVPGAANAGGESARVKGGPETPGTKAAAKTPSWPNPVMGSQASLRLLPPLARPAIWFSFWLLMIAALYFKARTEFGWGRRKRDLREVVSRRWKLIEPSLKKGDYRRVGADMTNLFSLVLGEVAGQAGFTTEELGKVLEKLPPSLRREYGDTIQKQFDFFQILSFAPETVIGPLKEPERLRQGAADARKLLENLIGHLNETQEGKA